MTFLGALLTLLATLILAIAALGILRLPDALARQHAATKAATIGVVLFAVGLGLIALGAGWGWGWIVRLGLMVILLLTTLPLASHAVARAAIAQGGGKKRPAGGKQADIKSATEKTVSHGGNHDDG